MLGLAVASAPFGPLPSRLRLCSLRPKVFRSPFATFPPNKRILTSSLTPRASVESVVEAGTDVKFPKELKVPGCSELLVLLGTGFREKVFAIIGIKVYAAGFYAEQTIQQSLDVGKGKLVTEVLDDSSLFSSIFQAPRVKALLIMLVRDVDGKTFWNALDDAITPRIEEPVAVDEAALSTFRNTFQGRDLKKGTSIFLTWAEPSKMLVSVSSNGLPSSVDATIESVNVTFALFDAFFGGSPVSPTLKVSVANVFSAGLNLPRIQEVVLTEREAAAVSLLVMKMEAS